jgi:hypothetical protein
MKQRPDFFSNFGWPDYLFYQLVVPKTNQEIIKTITMKIFGVVKEENKKSTRKKMPKIRLILSIICHRYFDTNHSITWFVY